MEPNVYPEWMNKEFTKGLAGSGIGYDSYMEMGNDAKLQLSNDFASNPNMFGQNGTQENWWGDTFKSFDNLLPTIGGLASMYMQWDKLQAEKNKARDAHNANAKMYNNQLVRANNLGKSIYGDSYKQDQTHVKKSTV